MLTVLVFKGRERCYEGLADEPSVFRYVQRFAGDRMLVLTCHVILGRLGL